MTREEAIKKWIVPAIEKTWNDTRCKEIIKALEQEPICETLTSGYVQEIKAECSDCISRQAAIDAVGLSRVPGHIKARIANLPPVTPAPKIGRWIGFEYPITDFATSYRYKCNQCDEMVEWLSNYCPDCGAKMQEVEE